MFKRSGCKRVDQLVHGAVGGKLQHALAREHDLHHGHLTELVNAVHNNAGAAREHPRHHCLLLWHHLVALAKQHEHCAPHAKRLGDHCRPWLADDNIAVLHELRNVVAEAECERSRQLASPDARADDASQLLVAATHAHSVALFRRAQRRQRRHHAQNLLRRGDAAKQHEVCRSREVKRCDELRGRRSRRGRKRGGVKRWTHNHAGQPNQSFARVAER
mmetsp:Transcript_13640/g.36617  ORF Transcript_13640/g.36617 Transcript_13640/m.36617 type:complete len:218 (+) Transcript_13640:3482-4135(+)